jgi:hypothetical protein
MDPVSGGTWQAPHTAYLLTAACADNDAAAGSAIWKGLDRQGQREVLDALSGQARQAMDRAHEHVGLPMHTDLENVQWAVCEQAVDALLELMERSPGTWALPGCSHCAEMIASTLACLSVAAARVTGISHREYARWCRETADRVPGYGMLS